MQSQSIMVRNSKLSALNEDFYEADRFDIEDAMFWGGLYYYMVSEEEKDKEEDP